VIISTFNAMRGEVVSVMLKTLLNFINKMFMRGWRPLPSLISTVHPRTLIRGTYNESSMHDSCALLLHKFERRESCDNYIFQILRCSCTVSKLHYVSVFLCYEIFQHSETNLYVAVILSTDATQIFNKQQHIFPH
jgi:hypothetical protein